MNKIFLTKKYKNYLKVSMFWEMEVQKIIFMIIMIQYSIMMTIKSLYLLMQLLVNNNSKICKENYVKLLRIVIHLKFVKTNFVEKNLNNFKKYHQDSMKILRIFLYFLR